MKENENEEWYNKGVLTKKELHDKNTSKSEKKKKVFNMKCMQYLEEARANMPTVLANFEDYLPPNRLTELTKNDLIPLFKSSFFRTHQIRTLLNQNSEMFMDTSDIFDKDIIDHSRLARLGSNFKRNAERRKEDKKIL